MIIKNHTIELKDTSASEMARFRQIMLGIWRQQIEDDKNGDEILQYLKEKHKIAKSLDAKYAETLQKPEEINLKGDRYVLNNDNHYQYTYASALNEVVIAGYISPLTSILNWIKNNIGNNAKELKLNSFPKDTPVNFTGIVKGRTISYARQILETIVDLKNIEFKISFAIKTSFLLDIFDLQKKLALRFETSSYEAMEFLAESIGYDLKKFKDLIIQYYKTEIAKAGNDKDKLDIIYEAIPDFILAALKTSKQLYRDLDILLNQNIFDLGGTDENQGILNILKALNKQDGKKLYKWLEERPKKVLQIYDSGKSLRNEFLKLIHQLATNYGNQGGPEVNKAYVSSKDSFIFKDIFLNTTRLETGRIYIESVDGSTWDKFWADFFTLDKDIGSAPKKYLTMPISRGNPMHLASLTTAGQKTGEFIEKTETILMLLHLSEQEKNKQFWELVSLTTSILGVASALRVIVVGGSKLAVTLAYIEITKEAAEMAMLNDKAKQILIQNDLGWLVDNWTKISIAVDITTFGLEGLVNLVKKGRKGAKALRDAGYTNEALKLEEKIEDAQNIINEFQRLETKLAKISSKIDDLTGNFPKVKEIEDEIRVLEEEFGMFFDANGEAIFDKFGGIEKASLKIERIQVIQARRQILKNGGKAGDLILTHNHLGNSALSPSDILIAIEHNLKEIRAVGSTGVDYSLKRRKAYPVDRDYFKIIEKVNAKMQSKYPKLHPTKYTTGGGDIEMAQFYAETLLEKFGDYIEYTKFTK
ncbi:hypothetical protein B0A67_10205 [Flavobacterium aquidurense]|jgi:hypothetical protein|uniref:hypothetical protein n=1 Tax=Flavobacterium aquidurense TaxID=362413 RepID=UPI00091069D1|nr:hypothetical protein [Flavobacterium aquidurense]OXA71719.1 hypothetical protein B0A67_10205 [Flavobacterium aquidurense]SHH20365.1 hypothetical protein SAMN05444481_11340 [Flavobacterium frigidimaris]